MSGDKLLLENYRPISILSTLSKVFEQVLKIRMTSYLEKYGIISEKQFGFREARSTQDAIALLTSKIYNALDKNIPTLGIFVDLAKAFDTVSHKELLDTLENIGFRGTSNKLMESYLNNRQQCVNIDDCLSEYRNVTCGVPQGTILGPILFTIYINDLFNLPCDGDIISYADDTVILYEDATWTSLQNKVQKDFPIIVNFFSTKLLTINAQKTFFLPFTSYSSNLPDFSKLLIHSSSAKFEISSKKYIKYLGLTIDCHLKWDIHAKNLVNKLRGLIAKFKLCKEFCNIPQLKILYYALVQSHISYGIIAWGGLNNIYLKKIEVMQKWIIKIMYGKCYRYPTNQLYEESQLLDIRQLFCQILLLNQYKQKNISLPITHKHNTRYKQHSVTLSMANKTIGQRSHAYIGPKIFNLLPAEIKSNNSTNKFKYDIKKWITNTPRLKIHSLVDAKNTYNII